MLATDGMNDAPTSAVIAFSGMCRKIWGFPLAMLHNAIINALVHSDYSHRGAPIRIAFFDDRVDIESPGILLPDITIEHTNNGVEHTKNGVPRIRNPAIARAFRERGLVEQWDSGEKRIFAEAQQAYPNRHSLKSLRGSDLPFDCVNLLA